MPRSPAQSAPARPARAVEIGGVRFTHPDRVVFSKPKLTKADVARYLERAAPRMLPHLAGRPVSLLRCPEGQSAECFFQRHAGAGFPDAIKRFKLRGATGAVDEYLTIEDERGLLAAAQFGVLEFHIWGAHVDTIERPDRLVFDLDPDPSVGFPAVLAAAKEIRDALAKLGLESFPLLTGGKGVHVVTPLGPRQEWSVVKGFARALAESFAAAAPERYVESMRKERRKGRIFIDYFRNDRSASAIAPYSPRARDGAPVAWPVTWAALGRCKSANAVTIGDARFGADPWQGYFKTRQNLTAAALKAVGAKEQP